MISLPGDSQSGVEDLLTKRRSRLDLRVDRIVDLRADRNRETGVGSEKEARGRTYPIEESWHREQHIWFHDSHGLQDLVSVGT
jgi:hypothetical protein